MSQILEMISYSLKVYFEFHFQITVKSILIPIYKHNQLLAGMPRGRCW
jgi:hypothetical protein